MLGLEPQRSRRPPPPVRKAESGARPAPGPRERGRLGARPLPASRVPGPPAGPASARAPGRGRVFRPRWERARHPFVPPRPPGPAGACSGYQESQRHGGADLLVVSAGLGAAGARRGWGSGLPRGRRRGRGGGGTGARRGAGERAGVHAPLVSTSGGGWRSGREVSGRGPGVREGGWRWRRRRPRRMSSPMGGAGRGEGEQDPGLGSPRMRGSAPQAPRNCLEVPASGRDELQGCLERRAGQRWATGENRW